jgi:hypothetical protein
MGLLGWQNTACNEKRLFSLLSAQPRHHAIEASTEDTLKHEREHIVTDGQSLVRPEDPGR